MSNTTKRSEDYLSPVMKQFILQNQKIICLSQEGTVENYAQSTYKWDDEEE